MGKRKKNKRIRAEIEKKTNKVLTGVKEFHQSKRQGNPIIEATIM